MSKFTKAIAAAIVLGAGLGVAQATTVTFASLTSPESGPAGDGTTYLEAGMTFTSSYSTPEGDAPALYHWGALQSYNADPGGATLLQNWHFGESVTVTRTGGGSFFLQSFDLADEFNVGYSTVSGFIYTDGSGTHNSGLVLDDAVGLQTFVFGYAGVTSFSLWQGSTGLQLDNVVVAVPEPQTYALLLAGLLTVGAALRRQRRGSRT